MHVTPARPVNVGIAATNPIGSSRPSQQPAPAAPALNPAAHQAIEGLRGELAKPFAFLAAGGCPWHGGKP